MTSGSPPPQAFLPLRPLELLVLTVLADQSLHGYAIRQAILDQSNNSIEVEAANLYRHIRRLHAEELLDISSERHEDDDERRRYFCLTSLGRRVLAAELVRLRGVIRFAEGRGVIARSRT